MKKTFLILIALTTTQVASAQTDLYIESVGYQYQGTTGYVHTNICNRGTTPNKTPRAHIRIMREGVWNVTEIQNIGNLGQNRCYNMKVNYGLSASQTYQIAVLLDPKEQLSDSDRSNNYVIADFSTTSHTASKTSASISPSDNIDEFDEYRTQTTSTSPKTQTTTNTNIEIPTVSAFPDTTVETLEGQAANVLQQRNIIQGYPDGEFKGSQSVNRAEIAKFILLAKEITPLPTLRNNGLFTDVEDGQWYVPYVIQAKRQGILSGYPDGSFRPAATVNTVEFLKIITKTFDLPEYLAHDYTDVSENDWFAPYAGVATQYNLFPERSSDQLSPGRELTRKEVAIAIYKILQAQ